MNIRYSLNYNQSFPKMPAVCVNRMIGDLSKVPSINQVTGWFSFFFPSKHLMVCVCVSWLASATSSVDGALLKASKVEVSFRCVFFIVWLQKPFHSMTLNKFNIASWFIINRLLLSCFMGRMSSWSIRSRGERVDVGVASWRGIHKQRNRDPALLRSAGRLSITKK